MSLLAAVGLLEGLEAQLLLMPAPVRVQARASLDCTLRCLTQPLQQVLAAAACVHLLQPTQRASDAPRPSPPYSPCTADAQAARALPLHSATSLFSDGAAPHASLVAAVWPELVGAPEGLAGARGPATSTAASAPPPAPTLLMLLLLGAMAGTQSQALAWAAGLLAGRLLAAPALLQAVLPADPPPGLHPALHAPHSNQLSPAMPSQPAPPSESRPYPLQAPLHPPFAPAAAASALPTLYSPSFLHAAAIPMQTFRAVPLLRQLLPRALLPALAARALLECSLGLDELALHVLEARAPDAANAWLQVGREGIEASCT